MKCQSCKKRPATLVVGNDGGGFVRKDAKVCDSFVCRGWATNGYPVTLHSIAERKERARKMLER